MRPWRNSPMVFSTALHPDLEPPRSKEPQQGIESPACPHADSNRDNVFPPATNVNSYSFLSLKNAPPPLH